MDKDGRHLKKTKIFNLSVLIFLVWNANDDEMLLRDT